MEKRKFANKIIFALVFALLVIFLLNFVLGSTVYTPSVNPTSSVNPTVSQGDDWKTNNIEQLTGVGNLVGLKNNDDFMIKNAQVKSKDGVVEVVLSKGGKMEFKGEMAQLHGQSLDSVNFDMTKKNRFVFKDNLITEAEFNSISGNKMKYTINNKKFDFPGGARAVLKDDAMRIFCNEATKETIGQPVSNDKNLPGTMKVSYVANGKDNLMINTNDLLVIPLKEGELSFSGENGRIDLLGEKVIFGDMKEDIVENGGIVLKNLEIKNFDSDKGTSIIFGHTDDFSTIDRPYINIESLSSLTFSPCAPSLNCLNGQYVMGYKIDIIPDKNGFAPEMRFNPGNPIFPEMKEGQYININSGDKRASLSVKFVATGDSLTEVRPDLKFYSSNGELINSGNKYALKEENGKYDWEISRVLNEQYPFSRVTFAENKGMGFISYHDATQMSNQLVTFVSGSLDNGEDMTPKVSLDNEGETFTDTTSLSYKIKTSIINALQGTAEKLFGYEKGKQVGDKLFNLLFSSHNTGRGVSVIGVPPGIS